MTPSKIFRQNQKDRKIENWQTAMKQKIQEQSLILFEVNLKIGIQ